MARDPEWEAHVLDHFDEVSEDERWYVHLFHVTREYGGPEEGGWYYTAGQAISRPWGHGSIGPFSDPKDAYEVCGHANAFADVEMNAGARPLSSVLSTGRYEWRVTTDRDAQDFPEFRPHYE
jgi:hypothetical protein